MQVVEFGGDDSHHVLPHVEDPFVAFREEAHGVEQVLNLDVGVGLRGEELHGVGAVVVDGEWAAGGHGPFAVVGTVAGVVDVLAVHVVAVVVDDGEVPAAVVVVGKCPFAEVEAGIAGLAVELVAFADGAAVGDAPAVAADDGVGGAVGVGDFELQEQLGQAIVGGVGDAAPLPVGAVVAGGGEASALEDDADGVEAVLAEDAGDVVGVEVDAAGVVAEGGLELFLRGYLAAVDVGRVDPQAADVEAGTEDVFLQGELFAEVAGGDGGVALDTVVVVVAAYPAGVPVGGREEADLEVLDVAREGFALAAVAVGDGGDDFPPAALAARERGAPVGDEEHTVS